ncbi:MAG: hypothetical protein WC306_01530 [Candidatus Paceibacterota bacterium]|jgi:hypothetical protein
MEKTIVIQRNKVFLCIFLSIFLFSAFFLNYLNVFAADCGGCGQPACPVVPPPTSSPHTSPPSSQNICTCSVRYSNTPCADTCRTDPRCSGLVNPPPHNPPPTSHYVPPTSPPHTSPPSTSPPSTGSPTCKIFEFTINDKTNEDQNPLIVWVNASLKGYFSVSDTCKTCTVTSNDNWNETYPISTIHSSINETFKIATANTYNYTLTCEDAEGEEVQDTLSLETVKALNLPWWREIIPNLTGFLRGMIR